MKDLGQVYLLILYIIKMIVQYNIMKLNFGNPSSTHSYGRQSKVLIESARKRIASHFNVSAGEIIFTSSSNYCFTVNIYSLGNLLQF